MPFGIWQLGFPMAIDWPKGRLITVKQIIIIVLRRPFLPGIPRKEEWDIIGEFTFVVVRLVGALVPRLEVSPPQAAHLHGEDHCLQ